MLIANFGGAKFIDFANTGIVLDGNSLFDFIDAASNLAEYNKIGAPGVSRTNFGVSGQTTLNMIADAATQVDPVYAPNKVLIVWEARNHLYFGGTSQAVKEAIRDYCLARQQVGWRVVILSCTKAVNDFSINGTNFATFDQAIDDFNLWLRANWRDFADSFCDAAIIPELVDYNNSTIFYDGIHLNALGYSYLVPEINKAIKRIRA